MGVSEDILATQTTETEDDLIRLSTGVILRGKPANIVAIISVMAQYPRPKAPIWRDPLMGRDMENFADPDYIKRVSAWQTEQTDAVLTVFILSGTELVSKPDGFVGCDPIVTRVKRAKKEGASSSKTEKDTFDEVISDPFIDDYSLLGLPMLPQNKKWRYLTWVKNVACVTRDDLKLIQEVVGRLSGVSSADVRAAEDFPGGQKEPG